jgi:hypothetical protein
METSERTITTTSATEMNAAYASGCDMRLLTHSIKVTTSMAAPMAA